MFRNLFEKILFTIFSFLFISFTAGILVYSIIIKDLPRLPEDLEHLSLSLPTEIYSSDGKLLKILGQRRPVPFSEISPNFLNAILAVEDARFYQHSGLDHRALMRALYINFKRRRIAQGGSTITQQLSKNLFFSFERNWIRKIKELLVALQIEATFSKRRILEAYVNQIYFGNGAYGVEDASQLYFGKSASELNVLQGAMLAGIPHSPNEANPFSSIEHAMKRTYYVLNRLVENGYLSEVDKDEAIQLHLDLAVPSEQTNPSLYFVDFVLSQLEKKYGKEFVYFGGIKIFTTLNTRFQNYAQQAVNNHLKFLDRKMLRSQDSSRAPLQGALVSIENQTGAVRVMLGGRNYSSSQFNRAVSGNRLPGSSFKPFVYLTAMELFGYHPASIVNDEPKTFEIPGTKPWEPKNFNGKYLGKTILKKALMNSANLVSARLIAKITPDKVIQTARKFGIKSPLGPNYSLALGTSPVSPLEMASAYSVIANLGFLNEPYFIQKIEDFNGNVLYEHFFHGIQRFSKKSIYPLLDMMQGVIKEGTGRIVKRMGFEHPSAGKTGTSNDYKDSWFVGFTKDFSTSVWVGKDDNTPVILIGNKGLTGSQGAAPIWVFFMKKALKGKSKVDFPVPDGIKFVNVNFLTGIQESKKLGKTLQVAVRDDIQLTPFGSESDVINLEKVLRSKD